VGVGAGRLVVRNREDFTAKNGNERTVPLRVISEILGHSNTQVTEMYSHLSPDVMDRAMEETFGNHRVRDVLEECSQVANHSYSSAIESSP
jgi:hypothetical protein